MIVADSGRPQTPPTDVRLGCHTCAPLPCHALPVVSTIPPMTNVTSNENMSFKDPLDSEYADEKVRRLPDLSWIAIVCGVSKEQRRRMVAWNSPMGLMSLREMCTCQIEQP